MDQLDCIVSGLANCEPYIIKKVYIRYISIIEKQIIKDIFISFTDNSIYNISYRTYGLYVLNVIT